MAGELSTFFQNSTFKATIVQIKHYFFQNVSRETFTIMHLEYYKDIQLNGLLYVLVYNSSKNIVCVGILKESDERWTDDEPAFYLHDFVSEVESCTDSKYKGILRQKL